MVDQWSSTNFGSKDGCDNGSVLKIGHRIPEMKT
jgi:hypothetical protein